MPNDAKQESRPRPASASQVSRASLCVCPKFFFQGLRLSLRGVELERASRASRQEEREEEEEEEEEEERASAGALASPSEEKERGR